MPESDTAAVEVDALAAAFRNVTGLDLDSAPRLPYHPEDDRSVDRHIEERS